MEFDYSKQYLKNQSHLMPQSLKAAEQYVRALRPYLPGDKNARILEIGPGNGLTLKLLGEMGFVNVLGFEADKNLYETIKNMGINVEYVRHEDLIDKLKSSRDDFELVFCMHVIEHIPVDQQLDFVRSVSNLLRPGGYFACETPNALGPIATYFRYADWTHTIAFTARSLTFLFKNGGFEVAHCGVALEEPPADATGKLASILNSILSASVKFVSRCMHRVHVIAALGRDGINAPISTSIFFVGRKIT